MNTLNMNGRKRPTLSEQIGRLDSILDGLADNLNEAVAQAVKEAVGSAVKEATQSILTEILTNEELLAKLRPEPVKTEQPAPAAPAITAKQPSWWNRLSGLAMVACQKVGTAAQFVCGQTVGLVQQGWAKVATLTGSCWQMLRAGGTSVCSRVKLLAGGSLFVLRGMGMLLWQFRKPVLIASGVGLVIGLCCYLAGPVVASAVSGMAGFAGSLLASGVTAFRRLLVGMNLPNS